MAAEHDQFCSHLLCLGMFVFLRKVCFALKMLILLKNAYFTMTVSFFDGDGVPLASVQ